MLNCRDVDKVVKALLDTQAYSAVRFLSDRQIVRATKPRRRKGKQWDARDSSVQLVLTIGAPNYLEREVIRRHKKAGKPLPKKVLVRDFPRAA